MKTWNTRYPIAVDLSDGAAALQLTSRRGVPAVRSSLRRAAAPDTEGCLSEEDQCAFVRDVLRSRAFKGRGVALLPPPDTILSYPLRVTPGKGEPLEAAILREARGVLDVPLEEVVLDYVSVQPDSMEPQRAYRVLLVAIRKADVERQMRMVSRAGGVLETLEPGVSALLRAHAVCGPLGARPSLLCHIGRFHTVAVVATRDGVTALRNVAWNTDRLRRRLSDNLDLQNAERDIDFLLCRHGLLDAVTEQEESAGAARDEQASATVAQLLAPLVDELVHELHSLMGYVRSLTPAVAFGEAFLHGEGAQVAGLDRYLGRELNLAVKAMNPLERVALPNAQALPDPVQGARYALALGLGMRSARWL